MLELTYNYTVKSYARGNDLGYIKIRSKAAFKAAQDQVGGRVAKSFARGTDLGYIKIRSKAPTTYPTPTHSPGSGP